MPGGKIAFYSGILPIAKNEDGIASIMGHEIAHAVARHSAERASTAMLTDFGIMAVEKFVLGQRLPQASGYVRQFGGLYVNYRPNLSFYCHGYINSRNPFYRQRPWHVQYRRPSVHTAVVYDRPYRRYYTPTRRHYNGPYRNNRRPEVYHGNPRSRTRSNHSLGYTNGNRNENSVTRSTTRRSVNRTNNNINMRNQTPVRSTERTRSTIVRTTTPNRGQYNRAPNTRSANVAQLNRRTTTHSVAQNNTRSQQKRTPSRSRKNN